MPEQHVKIKGKTFLYKQKAPFVASGMSVSGAIEYDVEADKLRCHECGEWFGCLATHIVKKHGLNARAYKMKHGLRAKTALVSERMRVERSRRITARNSADTEGHRENTLQGWIMARRRRQPPKKQYAEYRNQNGSCAAQLLERIKQVATKLGHTPSERELMLAGISRTSVLRTLNVKSIDALMSLADLVPNGRSRPHYSETVLTEMLRDFYVCHRRLPGGTDHRRGLLPAYGTFILHFGSMKNAYRAAGLGLRAAAEAGK